jgi:hypothetical protein
MMKNNQSWIRRGCVAALLVVFLAVGAHATILAPDITMNKMLNWSTAGVAVGKVKSRNCYKHSERNIIMTRYVLECIIPAVTGEYMKKVGDTVTVNISGGTMGNMDHVLDQGPNLKVGQEAVFFLFKNKGKFLFDGDLGFTTLRMGVVHIYKRPGSQIKMVKLPWRVETYNKNVSSTLRQAKKGTERGLNSLLEDLREVIHIEEDRSQEKAKRLGKNE